MTRAGRFEVPGADVDAIVANAEVLARWWEAQTLAVVKSYVNEKLERRALPDQRGRRVAAAGEGNSNLADGSMRENRNALRDVDHGSQGGKNLVPGLDFERLHKFERECGLRRESDVAVTSKARAGNTRGRAD
jgi:hypothetical protein